VKTILRLLVIILCPTYYRSGGWIWWVEALRYFILSPQMLAWFSQALDNNFEF
jgi:hypothetical protein